MDHITETAPRRFVQTTPYGTIEELAVPRTQAAELSHLLRLRDAATDLLQVEASTTEDTAELAELRARLNTTYDSYVAMHGPLNRFTERHQKDRKTGDDKVVQFRPSAMRIFQDDPFAPTVAALEVFDAERQTASKADIMRQRVVAARRPPLGADTPADALAISLDTYGEPRLAAIAELLGIAEDQPRPALAGLVFDDPETDRLVPAEAYLSRNVRTKLAAAVEHVIGSQWKVTGGDYGVNATSTGAPSGTRRPGWPSGCCGRHRAASWTGSKTVRTCSIRPLAALRGSRFPGAPTPPPARLDASGCVQARLGRPSTSTGLR